MKKLITLALAMSFFYTLDISAQKKQTCSTPKEDIIEDLNSITKCTIKSSKKTKNKRARTISVKVSAPRRYLKKRAVTKRSVLTSSNSLNTSGLSAIEANDSAELTKTLELRKSVAHLKNKLSAEEVRQASKFIEVDNIPTFEKCKTAKKDDKMDCFNSEMINHIQEHFSYPAEALIKKTEGEIWVRFVIDKNGEVTNIKTLGPKNGELLKLEAKRVASKLPKFLPALKNGKTVAVKYGFPINFSLNQ